MGFALPFVLPFGIRGDHGTYNTRSQSEVCELCAANSLVIDKAHVCGALCNYGVSQESPMIVLSSWSSVYTELLINAVGLNVLVMLVA